MGKLRKYLLKRLLQIVLTLWVFVTIVFLLLYAQPGDISQVYISDPKIPPEAREALKARLGLDQPLHIQYLNYLGNFFRGNLGISFSHYPRPVWDIILERLPRTFVLFMTATLIYYLIGFRLGKLIAWRRGGPIDYTATVSGAILWTVYTPWFALLMIWIFAVWLGWFPIGKFIDPLLWRQYQIGANEVFNGMILLGGAVALLLLGIQLLGRKLHWPRPTRVRLNLLSLAVIALAIWLVPETAWGRSLQLDVYRTLALDIARHMVLPVVTLTLIGFGGTMLLTRDSMLDVIKEDYVLAAKAKGLPERVVRDRHAARNALLPVVTSFVLALAFTVDGGIITETVFSWPGIGLTLLQAVTEEDMPLATGTFVFTGFFALVAHLVADVLYAYLDPRIRYH